jgi:hypothetical protein
MTPGSLPTVLQSLVVFLEWMLTQEDDQDGQPGERK